MVVKIPIRISTEVILNEREYDSEKERHYLGMSSCGEECQRKRFYGFHWASKRKKLTAKSKRIFAIGHLFEKVMIDELRENDLQVFRINEDGKRVDLTGDINEEQEELVGYAGHEIGHCDGRILGLVEAPKTVHLFEMKTMKQSDFLLFRKKGLKISHPKYYAQCQRYMRKMKLDRAALAAINKNTCDVSIERFELDKGFADDLERKSREILMSYSPPPKQYIAGFYKCGYCEHNAICHEEETPEKNCRTCDYSDLENEGKWSCSNKNAIKLLTKGKEADEMEISTARQRVGCKFYSLGWEL